MMFTLTNTVAIQGLRHVSSSNWETLRWDNMIDYFVRDVFALWELLEGDTFTAYLKDKFHWHYKQDFLDLQKVTGMAGSKETPAASWFIPQQDRVAHCFSQAPLSAQSLH